VYSCKREVSDSELWFSLESGRIFYISVESVIFLREDLKSVLRF